MKNSNYIYQINDLEKKIQETLGLILGWSSKKDYNIMHPENFDSLLRWDYKLSLQKCSKKTLKRINYWIQKFEQRPSLASANSFLSVLLNKTGIKKEINNGISIGPTKILISSKEMEIRRKKETWKELRDQAEAARLAYVREKGDFFKKPVEELVVQ